MKTIKMCGVLVHYPYNPYPQQLSISQVVLRACSRLQNGAVEIPTGCGKTMALLCTTMGYQVEQRYKILELMSNDDTIWEIDTTLDESQASDVGVEPDASSSSRRPPAPRASCAAACAAACAASPCAPVASTATEPAADADAASTPQSKRMWRMPDTSAPEDDDDDFVSLPRRRSAPLLKRARMDCGDGARCSTSCVGGGGDDSGEDPFADVAPSPCGRPLTDIEDTAVPEDRQSKKSPTSTDSGVDVKHVCSADSGDASQGSGAATKAEAGKEPEKTPEDVIDLVSSSSEDSDDSVECLSQSSQQPQAPAQAPQEVLSQRFWRGVAEGEYYEDYEDEDAPYHYGPRISREAMRETLRGRTREPTPGGEYGPTRRLTVPRAQAPIRVPKIFYASRTHLQLEQVANEIKRTHYCDARVVVLSSREFTCVNDKEFQTRKYANRTEMCHELLNDVQDKGISSSEDMTHIEETSSKSSCFYYSNSKRFATYDAMEAINVGPVVDINVLVQAGRRHSFCPYFAARSLISSADIILCPVNYLIDPLVRKSMNMELKGEIIVIDEAHMLDDLCRETASIIVPISDLKDCVKDCFALVDRNQLPNAHRTMADFLGALISWIDTNSQRTLSYGFNKEKEFSVSSTHLIASLEQSKITRKVVSQFTEGLVESSKHKTEILTNMSKASAFLKVISSKTETICERLGLIMDFVFQHPDDYVGSITLSSKYDPETSFHARKEQEWAIKLVCQNAGLIFNTLSSVTRSIIFSSATMSPLPAFAAELGIKIQNTSVRGHVIPPMQTWIGCLGRSENGHELYGRYSNTKTVEYMDEIGKIVLDVCVRVPHGVLVFVTSYWILESIVQRWKDTGLWTKIGEHKRPFSETRRAKDFNEVLKCFYNSVEEGQEALKNGLITVGNGCTGPLLVAVMRGKVSEGFNFADDKTRAIVTVGIPYPNIHEDTIRWKREYNKLHALSKPLQDAEGWYNTQAFRALSQSLGRGLRHRQDWCLLLLVDTRFEQPKYSQLLPLWMYERMINYRQYTGMLRSMEEYLKRMKLSSDDCKS